MTRIQTLPAHGDNESTAEQSPRQPDWQISSSKPDTHIVPAAHGYAFEVRAGDRFRIVDLHGEQVVDFVSALYIHGTSLFAKPTPLCLGRRRGHVHSVTSSQIQHRILYLRSPIRSMSG